MRKKRWIGFLVGRVLRKAMSKAQGTTMLAFGNAVAEATYRKTMKVHKVVELEKFYKEKTGPRSADPIDALLLAISSVSFVKHVSTGAEHAKARKLLQKAQDLLNETIMELKQ